MKVETPQILWHNGSENDNGKNAPLYSLAMLKATTSTSRTSSSATASADQDPNKCHVLATAGNTSEVNLWKVVFSKSDSPKILQNHSVHKIEHMVSLSRHDRSVNVVAFSPDGLHLATAGDSGAIIVWSVPPSKRSMGNRYWSTLEKENDLTCRIVSSPCAEGICDLAWSADSKRFVLGSIDHCVLIYEDASTNQDGNTNWKCVYRNTRDHTHYVQGVAYDPLGVYVSSMGSDRTVRVYARKPLKSNKKKQQNQAPVILQPTDPNTTGNNNGNKSQQQEQQQQQQRAIIQRALTDSKLELGKGKTLKYRQHAPSSNNSGGENTAPLPKKQYLFADESTVESFFRRLSWTKDGAFLVTPAALWHGSTSPDGGGNVPSNNSSSPSFATYLYARHRFDQPYKVLPGLEKPSVVIRPNPVLFQLPESISSETKENDTSQSSPTASQDDDAKTTTPQALPYRSIFAVLTLDTVLLYDTHHLRPLCIARGLHYAGLTDATWSADGRHLLVSSTDGYVSILSFQPGELGEVYTPPAVELVVEENKASVSTTTAAPSSLVTVKPPTALLSTVPPCEPGQTATLVAPPAKRAKKTRITPTLVSAPATTISTLPQINNATATKESSTDNATPNTTTVGTKKKRLAESSSCEETEVVGAAVTKLTLGGNNHNNSTEEKPKKKKRIQPMLVSIGGGGAQ